MYRRMSSLTYYETSLEFYILTDKPKFNYCMCAYTFLGFVACINLQLYVRCITSNVFSYFNFTPRRKARYGQSTHNSEIHKTPI